MAVPLLAVGFFGTLATLLVSVPGRILAAIGIGWITFGAYTLLTDNLIAAIQTNWGGIPSDALAYLTIAGFTDGIGLILGGVVVRVALAALPRLGRIL